MATQVQPNVVSIPPSKDEGVFEAAAHCAEENGFEGSFLERMAGVVALDSSKFPRVTELAKELIGTAGDKLSTGVLKRCSDLCLLNTPLDARTNEIVFNLWKERVDTYMRDGTLFTWLENELPQKPAAQGGIPKEPSLEDLPRVLIHTLDFSKSKTSVEAMRLALKECPFITSLTFPSHQTHLTSETACPSNTAAVLADLPGMVRELSLAGTDVGKEGLGEISSKECLLQALDVSDCENLNPLDLKLLDTTKLTALSMRNSVLGVDDEGEVWSDLEISEFAETCKNLKFLDLSGSFVHPKLLTEIITKAKGLNRIYLNEVRGLSTDFYREQQDFFSQCVRLRVSGQPIAPFMESVMHSKTLVELDISGIKGVWPVNKELLRFQEALEDLRCCGVNELPASTLEDAIRTITHLDVRESGLTLRALLPASGALPLRALKTEQEIDGDMLKQVVDCCPNLESLTANGSKLTKACFADLARLRKLESLHLVNCRGVDANTFGEYDSFFGRLKEIGFSGSPIDDACFSRLCTTATRVEVLNLGFSSITTLPSEVKFPKLKLFHVIGASVEEEEVEKFIEAHPTLFACHSTEGLKSRHFSLVAPSVRSETGA